MPLQSGDILHNRYRILNILGQGGFGAVYQAADMTLQRPCAVKENLDPTPEGARQFEKEALLLAQLMHPNLPRVNDHFTIPNQGQYLVMDFIRGEDLQTKIERDGPISPAQALTWISQIADALTYLHTQTPPIIHRDIKPANIRVTPEGNVYLVDFGLAKAYDPHRRTTVAARAVTPGYSPPEQYGQGNTDERTDQYALAATLYALLTGEEPQESVERVVDDKLTPVHVARPQIARHIGHGIVQAMNLKPSLRFSSVAEFKGTLVRQAVPITVQPSLQAAQAGSAMPIATPVSHQPKKINIGWWVGGMIIFCSIVLAVLLANPDVMPSTPTPDYSATSQAEQNATERVKATEAANATLEVQTRATGQAIQQLTAEAEAGMTATAQVVVVSSTQEIIPSPKPIPADIPIIEGAGKFVTYETGDKTITTYEVNQDLAFGLDFYQEKLGWFGWSFGDPYESSSKYSAILIRENRLGDKISVTLRADPFSETLVVTIIVIRAK